MEGKKKGKTWADTSSLTDETKLNVYHVHMNPTLTDRYS